MDTNIWKTIPEAARMGPLTQTALRKMRDKGTLPCIMVGKKALIHYPRLLELLETTAMKNESTKKVEHN